MTPTELQAQLPSRYSATFDGKGRVTLTHLLTGERSIRYQEGQYRLALDWALEHAECHDEGSGHAERKPKDSAMTPEQLAAQLPQGYKVHQNLNDHGVEVVQVHHAFLDAHSQSYPLADAHLALGWALDHASRYDADKGRGLNEPYAAALPTAEEKAQVAAIAVPEGYAIRIRGAIGNTPQQYRAIYPDKQSQHLHPTAELAAQECIRHYITQHTRREGTVPPGYGITAVSEYDDSALMHVEYPDGDTSLETSHHYAPLRAHAWDHFEAQPDRKDCPPGYRVVNVDGDGEYWEVIHPTGPDGSHFERREWAVAAARDYHHLLMAREEFRRLGRVKSELPTLLDTLEERLAAARAQLPEKYQIDPVGARFRVSLYGAVLGRERKTPEAALAFAQKHEAISRIRLEEGVEHSHRDKIAALIQPHPNMTAEGRLSGNGSGANTYSMWRLYYCNAVSPWFSIIVLDNARLNVADLFNVQPQEVTAMTHPAHTGPALNEITKMIQLLESGEWADTFPTTAEGQRLEYLLNNMIERQRKSDADGHRMADQLQELRAKPESSRLAYEEMEALRSVFETNDIDALKTFEPKFAISSVWHTSLYDRMQECAKREAELRCLVAEADLKAISAPEPAPVPGYTLEDKIVDLALDVIAGTAHPERAKVLLREIIKEAKA